MKIGIDGRELIKGKKTGIGRFLENLLSFIAHHNTGDKDFILYGNQRTFAGFKGITVKRKEEVWTPFWDQVTLPIMLRRDGIDLFFSPYDKGPVLTRVPLIITIHDLIPCLFPEGWRDKFLYTLSRRLMARKASMLITVSEYSKKDLVRVWKVPEERIRVIPCSVSPHFHPMDQGSVEEVKSEYGIEGEYLLYVGNFKAHKNLSLLLKAYAMLPMKIRETHTLVLAGGGKDLSTLQGTARKLGIRERLILTGHVPDHHLPALYSGARLFLFPSLYEGFGLPVIEAMACGTPVISSKASSLPEVAGDAGIMVDPEKPEEMAGAIKMLLSNQTLQRELRHRGLKRAELFRIERIAPRFLGVIEEVSRGCN